MTDYSKINWHQEGMAGLRFEVRRNTLARRLARKAWHGARAHRHEIAVVTRNDNHFIMGGSKSFGEALRVAKTFSEAQSQGRLLELLDATTKERNADLLRPLLAHQREAQVEHAFVAPGDGVLIEEDCPTTTFDMEEQTLPRGTRLGVRDVLFDPDRTLLLEDGEGELVPVEFQYVSPLSLSSNPDGRMNDQTYLLTQHGWAPLRNEGVA